MQEIYKKILPKSTCPTHCFACPLPSGCGICPRFEFGKCGTFRFKSWWHFHFLHYFMTSLQWITLMSYSCEIALRKMKSNIFEDEAILVQVIAWCHQTLSHYLNQGWPRFMSSYGDIRPQWVISSWLCGNICCHRPWSSIFQWMDWHMFSTKWLSESMLNHFQLRCKEQFQLQTKMQKFTYNKMNWKYIWNVINSIQATIGLKGKISPSYNSSILRKNSNRK